MARRSFIQINGVLYEKGVDQIPEQEGSSHAAILGDLPDFISPIDGSVVRGRKGLREHCKRHDVVPTEELKGLPPKMANVPYQLSKQEIQERREFIYHQVDTKLRRN
jgi:hypothetical protein